MRLRWKLLILLLILSLAPLAIMALRAQRATLRLGQNIGGQARAALHKQVERQLRLFITARAELLARDADLIRIIVERQAAAADRVLAEEPPPNPPVRFSADYRDPAKAPGNLTPHPQTRRIATLDVRSIPPVNTNGAVLHLAPGVDPDVVTDDIGRLAALAPAYRSAAKLHGELVFWQYTALQSGVFSCFPGSGNFPPDYDPRTRHWYTQAAVTGALTWTPPYVDAATGLVMMSCVQPVFGPDGAFAGVTGVDVSVDVLASRGEMPNARTAAAFVVLRVPRRDFDPVNPTFRREEEIALEDTGLFVLAATTPRGELSAAGTASVQWLESDDPARQQQFIHRLYTEKTGVMRLPYEGADALWAYGDILRASAFLVAILPYAEVEAEAERAEATVMSLTDRQRRETAVVFFGVVVVVLVIAMIGSRAVTTPVGRLVEGARRIGQGHFDTRVDVRSRDELGELGRSFNDMVPQLADRMRMRQALNVAQEVQQHLLPANPPRVPGLDIAGVSQYCDETGGDYYDYLEFHHLERQTIGIAVGDVTGHGVAAALLMATGRALLRGQSERTGNMAALLEHVNRHLAADSVGGRFMTLYYLQIDADRGAVRWVSAGHDAAIVYNPPTESFRELSGGGLPLGVAEDWEYEEYADQVAADEVIVMGTDGIWEAANAAGEMYGKQRLRAAIARHVDASADAIARDILADVTAFRGSAPQGDDITLVVIKITAGSCRSS